MLTIADLKRRLTPGTELRLVQSLMGPCDKKRVVHRNKPSFVTFTGEGVKESYLYWPKASQLRGFEGGFEIIEDGEVAVRYLWVQHDS